MRTRVLLIQRTPACRLQHALDSAHPIPHTPHPLSSAPTLSLPLPHRMNGECPRKRSTAAAATHGASFQLTSQQNESKDVAATKRSRARTEENHIGTEQSRADPTRPYRGIPYLNIPCHNHALPLHAAEGK